MKKKQQQQSLIVLLLCGLGYYFLVYLPEEEKKKIEAERLKAEESRRTQQNQKTPEEIAKELKEKRLQEAKDKDLHWWREPHSWADRWIQRNESTFKNAWKKLENDLDTFNIAAPRTFHFPVACWSEFTAEQKELANKVGGLLKPPKPLHLSPTIMKWYNKVKINPVRGIINEQTRESDNNALFYGAPRTGKTALAQKICYETNKYPLIEIKGSTLSPRKQDYEAGVTPLEKFMYTLVQIEHDLEDNFGFTRNANGEVPYILFVDEADLISKHASIDQYTKLTFLKECMEGIDKSEQSQNLWLFATNHLVRIDPAVYEVGRLSNSLNFSWTLGTFFHYAKEHGIYNQFPKHWKETATLKKEDLQWANNFSVVNFKPLFLPFWNAFYSNSENREELEEKEATENQEGQEGIQLGEFFEFFWNLKEGGQLDDFIQKKGKFVSPRKTSTEESLTKTNEVLDVRLSELIETLEEQTDDLRKELELTRTSMSTLIRNGVQDVVRLIGKLKE